MINQRSFFFCDELEIFFPLEYIKDVLILSEKEDFGGLLSKKKRIMEYIKTYWIFRRKESIFSN
jgi:hypothetical protein